MKKKEIFDYQALYASWFLLGKQKQIHKMARHARPLLFTFLVLLTYKMADCIARRPRIEI